MMMMMMAAVPPYVCHPRRMHISCPRTPLSVNYDPAAIIQFAPLYNPFFFLSYFPSKAMDSFASRKVNVAAAAKSYICAINH